MFDTVGFSITEFQMKRTPKELTQQGWYEQLTHVENSKEGNVSSLKYYLNIEGIHFTYYPIQRKLNIEFSLTKACFGNNFMMLREQDKQPTLNAMKKKIEGIIGQSIPALEDLELYRLDICWNFKTGPGQIPEFIHHFRNISLPYLKLPVIIKNETIKWLNTVREIKLYDKEKECKDPRAKDIFRAELILRSQEMIWKALGKQIDANGKRVIGRLRDFNFEICRILLNEYLDKIHGKNPIPKETREHQILKKYHGNKRFVMLGLLTAQTKGILNSLNMSKATKSRYKKLLEEIGFGLELDPLHVKPLFEKLHVPENKDFIDS